MRRRSVLAGAVAGPLVLGLGIKASGISEQLPALTLYDARLQLADQAARKVRLRGGETRQTNGEIVALLLRERLFANGGTVLGITGHAEYQLAADVARMAGREVAPLMQVGANLRWFGSNGQDHWRPLVAEMLEGRDNQPAKATAYVWTVA